MVTGANAEASEALEQLVAAQSWHFVGNLEASCWSFPNATWGHCCARYRGDSDSAAPARHPQFRSRSQQLSQEGMLAELRGCPSWESGCCAVHPRLSQHWKHFSGLWTIKYADGLQQKMYVSELGLVQVRKHRDSKGKAVAADVLLQLEETPNPRIARVRPMSTGSGTSEIPLSEHWHFTHGVVNVLAITSDGRVVIGKGVRETVCLGCI